MVSSSCAVAPVELSCAVTLGDGMLVVVAWQLFLEHFCFAWRHCLIPVFFSVFVD
jgi:hypothetical protein